MTMHLTIPIHVLNGIVGSMCVVILGLVIHANTLCDALENTNVILAEARKIPLSFLYWPGCGGIVDCLLWICLSVASRVSLLHITLCVHCLATSLLNRKNRVGDQTTKRGITQNSSSGHSSSFDLSSYSSILLSIMRGVGRWKLGLVRM
jgi:hypothetical protein